MMRKTQVDLNSDMGEGFGAWKAGDGQDDQIIEIISSANIATGFHAGDPNIMNKTVERAAQLKVGIGAHPGYNDLVGFGRRFINAPHDELVNDMLYQMGALDIFARLHNIPVQHVKPHGALYMTLYKDEDLSARFIDAVQKSSPDLYLFCMATSKTYQVAQKMGMKTVREFYGDREYDNSGSIVFTRKANAFNPEAVAEKLLLACTEGKVKTVEGDYINVEFDSICIHSDTPGALELLQTSAKALKDEGIKISNQFAF